MPQDVTRGKLHISHEESFLSPPPSPPSPSATPVSIVGRGGTGLTPREREEVLRGWRKCLVVYGGDPDLAPICSYEIAWLVRILYLVAQYFNRNVRNPSHVFVCLSVLLGSRVSINDLFVTLIAVFCSDRRSL